MNRPFFREGGMNEIDLLFYICTNQRSILPLFWEESVKMKEPLKLTTTSLIFTEREFDRIHRAARQADQSFGDFVSMLASQALDTLSKDEEAVVACPEESKAVNQKSPRRAKII
jgi:hypothetical protein